MKSINVGLIGFGTVGTGVVRLLMENSELIRKRLGCTLRLKKIADIDVTSPRPVQVHPELLTTDAWDIIRDPQIDIVIELIGGFEPAKTFIIEALSRGKHVVTANKALLATYGDEIFGKARSENLAIGFEASVGGTIPIIKTLKESLVANEILSFMAIMNGTCNYILTKMGDEGKPFDLVLKEAQELGFAEADASMDIEAIDTAHKMVIALTLAYGKRVKLESIYREGITNISPQDIEFAKEFGYKIKLLGLAFKRGNRVEARIHPTLIPLDHMLANVGSNYNAFHIVGSASGPVFLYGQGAGSMPTASAVVSDVIDISREILKEYPGKSFHKIPEVEEMEEIDLVPFEDIETNYYFRFMAADRPGVLSKISGILGENNISIAAVIQKGRKKDGAVPVVMTTHKAREKSVQDALKRIDQLDVVMDKTIIYRIEDEKL
ncbi:MAG: homoserine dehydrogenase [Syntrophales bacterium]|nr:homoserine dehydrogenase [Syntrophales bacterium]